MNHFKGQFVCFSNSYESYMRKKNNTKISQLTIDLLVQYFTSGKQLSLGLRLKFIQCIL